MRGVTKMADIDGELASLISSVGDSPIIDTRSRRLPVSLIAGSQDSITKISANWNPKSKRHYLLCKEPVTNRFIYKNGKICHFNNL